MPKPGLILFEIRCVVDIPYVFISAVGYSVPYSLYGYLVTIKSIF
jgi:hypothetical protein